MALNSGFERYEGSAYFGYDIEGDGYEAIVVVGENQLEIRDLNDNPLSQWLPGTYTCNNEEIPLRAYFNGNEWLAPHDLELQAVLDRFQAYPVESDMRGKKSRSWSWAWALLVIALVCVVSFFALRPLTKQLLSPAIRESLEEGVVASLSNEYELCNASLNETSHSKIRAKFPAEDFQVFTNMAQNYARMPTGKLAVNAEFAQNLDNVDTLVSILQLAQTRNAEHDPAAELISHFSLTSRIKFLANAEVDQAELRSAWQEFAQTERFSQLLYRDIPEPVGDYQNLSTKIGWDPADYPSQTSDIALTDEEWLSLFTFCEKEN